MECRKEVFEGARRRAKKMVCRDSAAGLAREHKIENSASGQKMRVRRGRRRRKIQGRSSDCVAIQHLNFDYRSKRERTAAAERELSVRLFGKGERDEENNRERT